MILWRKKMFNHVFKSVTLTNIYTVVIYFSFWHDFKTLSMCSGINTRSEIWILK